MITAKDVQALRQKTGAGIMDAKRALQDAEGDVGKATELLRERGLAAAAKRTDRAQTEGAIGSYLHQQAGRAVIGVLVELAAETDFVAKSAPFQKAANDLAMHIAAARPTWVRREEVPKDALAKEREIIAAQARNEGKPEQIIDTIVAGRVGSFYRDNVLYDQVFVRSDEFEGTVAELVQQLGIQMGENISVARFSRLQVGQGAG
ncbi:MAG: translation elongation factor Ts [Acidimicrobiia bacterium]